MIQQLKLRLACAALGLAVAVPAVAQDNSSADIGPSELSNFSLNGSVTRPAERPTAPATTPAPAPATQAPATTETRPAAPAPGTADRPAAAPPSAAATTAQRPATSGDDLLARPPTLPQATSTRPTTTAVAGAAAAPSLPITPSETGFSFLPWLAALLFAAGGGAVIWFFRQRRAQRYAGAGAAFSEALAPRPSASETEAPAPLARSAPPPAVAPSQPAPQPAASPAPVSTTVTPPAERPAPAMRTPLPTTLMPQPAPAPAPAPSPARAGGGIVSSKVSAGGGGIVSTGLRPWIEVDLVPERALYDDEVAAIAFDIILVNSGNAPARDVTIEARLMNAGNQLDQDLSTFFTSPKTVSDPIPLIAPFAKIGLRSAVRIPRADIREYEVDGRKMFVPLVGVSARYRWSSGEGQTGAGFLVGRGGEDAEKLGPLRIDQGARSWDGLRARRYDKGIRR